MTVVDINIHHLPEDLFSNDEDPQRIPELGASRLRRDRAASSPWRAARSSSSWRSRRATRTSTTSRATTRPSRSWPRWMTRSVDYGIMRVPVWQEWLDRWRPAKRGQRQRVRHRQALERPPLRDRVRPAVGRQGEHLRARALRRSEYWVSVGVQMACHYGQLYLDDEVFEPYLKVLNELNVPVIVHHTPLPVEWKSIIDYTNFRREYGRIQSTRASPSAASCSAGCSTSSPTSSSCTPCSAATSLPTPPCSPRTPPRRPRPWSAPGPDRRREDQELPGKQHLLRPDPPALVGQAPGRSRTEDQRHGSFPVRLLVPGVLRLDESGRRVHQEGSGHHRRRTRNGPVRQRQAVVQPPDLARSTRLPAR